MTRPRIQHVSLPRPYGQRDLARAFYSDLLGFPECPVPEALSELDLIWFQVGDGELHLYGQETANEHAGRHACVEIDDLEATRARLSAAGYDPRDTIAIPNRPRFFCEDPFGNLLEFTTILE